MCMWRSKFIRMVFIPEVTELVIKKNPFSCLISVYFNSIRKKAKHLYRF